MMYFATLFNRFYLTRGLVMLQSLEKHCPEFTLFILCLDEETYQYFLSKKLSNVIPIGLWEIEGNDEHLHKAKLNRSLVEYYFTLSPVLPLYIFEHYAHVNRITTIDADLYFFSDPTAIMDEINNFSIAITPHRFTSKLIEKGKFGLYNVSFQSFKRDETSLQCLRDWRSNCLEWCFDRYEDDKFADQKYLDAWIQKYKNVRAIEHPGIGLAPWNVDDYVLSKRDNSVFVNNHKVIFYHFQGIRFLSKRLIYTGLKNNGTVPGGLLFKLIYSPYINALIKLNQNTDKITRDFKNSYTLKQILTEGGFAYYTILKNMIDTQKIGFWLVKIKHYASLKFRLR